MKAALLPGVAIAAALVVGVQVAAQEAPPAEQSCPWIRKHLAETQAWKGSRMPEAPAPETGVPSSQPAPKTRAGAPHPLEISECSEGAWKDFLVPSFDSQAACEGWVRENLTQRVLGDLPPGESREFRFPQHGNRSGAILRTGAPLLI